MKLLIPLILILTAIVITSCATSQLKECRNLCTLGRVAEFQGDDMSCKCFNIKELK